MRDFYLKVISFYSGWGIFSRSSLSMKRKFTFHGYPFSMNRLFWPWMGKLHMLKNFSCCKWWNYSALYYHREFGTVSSQASIFSLYKLLLDTEKFSKIFSSRTKIIYLNPFRNLTWARLSWKVNRLCKVVGSDSLRSKRYMEMCLKVRTTLS